MTYADINKMFTAEVSKYLARGYHFNTASMSGSQGETAKVDLTNGTEIIRVLLRTFSDGWDKQGTELFVGRVARKRTYVGMWLTASTRFGITVWSRSAASASTK